MELPNLPTDNLYKFMALSGITLIIFCLSMFFLRLWKIEEKTATLKVEVKELILERQILAIKDSLLQSESKTVDPSDFINRTRQIAEAQLSLITKGNLISAKNDNNESDLVSLENHIWIIVFWITVGFLLAFFGFYWWYTRVQKLLDTELKKKINNIMEKN